MTDIIFLLLIFFMITSTMVSPNAIKVLLPQGRQQTSAKPLTRVIIDKNLNFYTAFGNEDEMPIDLDCPHSCKGVPRRNPICMWLFMRMRLCLTAK